MIDADQTPRGETAAEQPAAAEQRPATEDLAAAQQAGGEEQPSPAADGGQIGDGAAELQGDLDELVRVAAQRDEYLALAQRTQADFENYRKRVARDAASASERGAMSLAKELLPALDNLDRAIGAAQEDDPLLEGVRLVRSELAAALARAGIEAFRPLGEQFDPNVHEAVATVGTPNGAGQVVEVYQDGYRLGENIIRPARVVVGA
jgi:molecular chaperone GrpE